MAGTVKDCKNVFHLYNKKNPKKYCWSIAQWDGTVINDRKVAQERKNIFVHIGEKVG